MSNKYTEGDNILYEVKGRTAIITLNLPKAFNALTGSEYRRLEQLVQMAGDDEKVFITIIQSTGKFFSAGANFKKGDGDNVTAFEDTIELAQIKNKNDPAAYQKYADKTPYSYAFGARNLTITNTFINHPNVLVVSLNGPVIGLSAALVAHADFIYATDNAYLLTPFSNIGLVTEGAASYTLLHRLGQSLASEALIMSKPISAADLYRTGFLNELYPQSKFKSVEEFNLHVQNLLQDRLYGLDEQSVYQIKKLIKTNLRTAAVKANHDEVIGGIDRFSVGAPQARFLALKQKTMKHKM